MREMVGEIRNGSAQKTWQSCRRVGLSFSAADCASRRTRVSVETAQPCRGSEGCAAPGVESYRTEDGNTRVPPSFVEGKQGGAWDSSVEALPGRAYPQ